MDDADKRRRAGSGSPQVDSLLVEVLRELSHESMMTQP